MVTKIRIFGAGIQAQIVSDMIEWQFNDQFEIEGYYDDKYPELEKSFDGKQIFGNLDRGIKECCDLEIPVFLALGTFASAKSVEILHELNEKNVRTVNLISKQAHISLSAIIGKNSLIMPGVFIGAHVKIGNLITMHGGSAIEHHCLVGDNVLIGPGVSIASGVKIGDHCFLGSGASVIPTINIGRGCLIGAGSTVIKDTASYSVWAGSPARQIRLTRKGDELPAKEQIEALDRLMHKIGDQNG